MLVREVVVTMSTIFLRRIIGLLSLRFWRSWGTNIADNACASAVTPVTRVTAVSAELRTNGRSVVRLRQVATVSVTSLSPFQRWRQSFRRKLSMRTRRHAQTCSASGTDQTCNLFPQNQRKYKGTLGLPAGELSSMCDPISASSRIRREAAIITTWGRST